VAVEYDPESALHFLIRGLRPGQTVNMTANGEHKSRWFASVTHDVDSPTLHGPVHKQEAFVK
jgi:hypothetical protein